MRITHYTEVNQVKPVIGHGLYAYLVDNIFDRALSIERSELLKKNVKPDKIVFPLVLDYNPILPDVQ